MIKTLKRDDYIGVMEWRWTMTVDMVITQASIHRGYISPLSGKGLLSICVDVQAVPRGWPILCWTGQGRMKLGVTAVNLQASPRTRLTLPPSCGYRMRINDYLTRSWQARQWHSGFLG
jgi:hypothetical protein